MVYIVQEVEGRNILSAGQFGTLKVLLPKGEIVLSPSPTIRKLQRELREFGDKDYLLLMGDPVAIGLAASIAADMNRGRVKYLKWDRQEKMYYVVETELHPQIGINETHEKVVAIR